MRKYISDEKPEIEVPIKDISHIHCEKCRFHDDFSEAEQRIWFVNLEKPSEYICLKCMKNTNGKRRYSPYVCVKLDLDGSNVESQQDNKDSRHNNQASSRASRNQYTLRIVAVS